MDIRVFKVSIINKSTFNLYTVKSKEGSRNSKEITSTLAAPAKQRLGSTQGPWQFKALHRLLNSILLQTDYHSLDFCAPLSF